MRRLSGGGGSPSWVAKANVRRTAQREPDRAVRWCGARDAAWRVLEPWVSEGSRVAVVGAGNCDDLPLTRLVARAGSVDLIDLDAAAPRQARRREPRALRRRISVVRQDVTGGAADAVIAAALAGRCEDPPAAPVAPGLGRGDYDLVVGDLLYSQLLYPALLDLGVAAGLRLRVLQRAGPVLTARLVALLHAAAPTVVHLHDPVCWQPGSGQPVDREAVFLLAAADPLAALALTERCRRPVGCDPRPALLDGPYRIEQTGVWRWAFTATVDYAVCATVATRPASDSRAVGCAGHRPGRCPAGRYGMMNWKDTSL